MLLTWSRMPISKIVIPPILYTMPPTLNSAQVWKRTLQSISKSTVFLGFSLTVGPFVLVNIIGTHVQGKTNRPKHQTSETRTRIGCSSIRYGTVLYPTHSVKL